MADKIHVFVDNSNIWIHGKTVSGRLLNPPVPSDYWYRVDAGHLLSHVLDGRCLATIPFLYGSVPPPNDTVWEKIREAGFDVKLFERNVRNKEKGLDMEMGLDIYDTILENPNPGVIAIIAGDADYIPVIDRVKKRGWVAEVWYWYQAAKKLKEAADRYENLDSVVYEIGFRQGAPK